MKLSFLILLCFVCSTKEIGQYVVSGGVGWGVGKGLDWIVNSITSYSSVDEQKVLLGQINYLAKSMDDEQAMDMEYFVSIAKLIFQTAKIKFDIKFNDFVRHVNKISDHYEELLDYIKYNGEIENSTVMDFVRTAVSHSTDSVRNSLQEVNQLIISRLEIGDDLLKLVLDMNSNIMSACARKQSPHQLLYYLYNIIIEMEQKGYFILQYSYMTLRVYGDGNYTRELKIEEEHFANRTSLVYKKMQEAMRIASRELWRCDPDEQVEEKTYLEITQLLQGYIENEVDLHPDGCCKSTCADYQNTRSYSCYQNLYCSKQRKCQGKIFQCKHVHAHMSVCPSKQTMKRRYDYIDYYYQVYGRKRSCPQDLVQAESWTRWFWRCSYCMCLCDEEGYFSDRYFSLKESFSDVFRNRIITGVKFTKANRIIHLQIQQGQLLPKGFVDKNTLEWLPIDNFTINDRNVHRDQSYSALSRENRAVDLDILQAEDGYVLTGIRFAKIESHLNLQIHVTPFDFTTGQLKSDVGEWIRNSNTGSRNRIMTEDKDVPILWRYPSRVKSKHNDFLEFTHTSFEMDAAQTTVPFLDSQTVMSYGYPLSGAGIYYKTSGRSGGYIGIKLITFDFSNYLEPATEP